MVKLLTRVLGADVNAKNLWGGTVLHMTVENNHVEVMRHLMLESVVDTNAQNNNGMIPLHLAASNGNIEAVKLLTIRSDANTKDNYG